ncbi:MAG: heme-binding protein [Rhodospirillales bacterium]|nr:MAG: heme-binding protein [Rhodospirillales bacterium]
MFGIRSGTEQPTYEIVAQLVETIEVRRYPPRVAAEALVEAADEKPARNAAFRLLFDYISGANRSNRQIAMTTPVETAAASEKIAMTVPVESARTGEATLRMRFFLPTGLDLESTPAPLDPRVRIVALPGQTVAALRFSGSRGRDAVAEKTTQLLRALAETPWRPTAEPVAYFYDPPWTLPFLRRNEVVVAVER